MSCAHGRWTAGHTDMRRDRLGADPVAGFALRGVVGGAQASSSCLGKKRKTSAIPIRIATIAARYAHWSPLRNDDWAAAVTWLA